MQATEYYAADGTPLRCDCEPARSPRIVQGPEVAEWSSLLDDVKIADTNPIPDGPIPYVATCPDWPGGCEWWEFTVGPITEQ